jgi:hypothetical protein
MSSRLTIRLVVASSLVVGGVFTLSGCGGSKPSSSKAAEQKEREQANGSSDPKSVPAQPPQMVDLDQGVGKEAVAFLKGLGESTAKADQLSAGFVRAVGLPAELPSDKAKGFSPAAAESWMKRVGSNATFGLPAGFAGADAAVLWGGFQGQGRKGDYSLRMVKVTGVWKVDYFALTSAVHATTGSLAQGPDAEYQRFAARAVGGLLCDGSAMTKDERTLTLAAGLTPAFRTKLAEPFGSDRDQGFDYNRGKLILEAEKLGGGAESYSTSPQATPTEFRLEVVKPGGVKSAYLLKLAKGSAPGQWLVESISPQ